MDNLKYFKKQHPPLYEDQEGEAKVYVGKSDRDWTYFENVTKVNLSTLLERLPKDYHNFALVEDWMVELIDPDHQRDRELICDRYVLSKENLKMKIGQSDLNHSFQAGTFLRNLIPEDAYAIQKLHEYSDYTDIDYVKMRIHLGVGMGIEKDGELIGWGLTHDDGAIGFVYVLPEYRGQGIAKAIVIRIIQQLNENDLPIYCHIEEDNLASITLFEGLGFVKENRIRWFSL